VAEHIIEFVARDRTGITAVVTETGVIDADVVIRNIRSGHSGYAVAAAGRRRAQVRSLTVLGSAYLFANWDGSKRNNLHDLAFHAPAQPVVVPSAGARLRAALGAVFGWSRSGADRRLGA
jgi:acetylornithine deacetylase/succinyl-diaminopimelate desuccinylase-like protein